MGRTGFVDRGGEQVFVLDFSGFTPEELGPVIREARLKIDQQQPASPLTLTKVDGARFNNDTVKQLKMLAKADEPYVRKAAIVGLSGLQQLALTAVSKFTGRDFIVCDTLEEAMSRLVSDS